MAKAVNRTLRLPGRVWADRHHARDLPTPREVRHALVYVLQNWRKHGCGTGMDSRSSAPWFTGWRVRMPPPRDPSTVATAETWLARVGWRRHGLLDIDDVPRRARNGPTRTLTRTRIWARPRSSTRIG
jgi:hypothetical protein